MTRARPSSSAIIIPFFFVFSFVLFFLSAAAASDNFIYGGCSQQRYASTSSFQSNLDSLLNSLANAAFSTLYAHFNIGKAGEASYVTGILQCRGDVSNADCAHCVQSAIGQFHLLCPNSCGSVIQLDACFVKYDNATFLGVLDTTLIYKKCSPSSTGNYDSEFPGRRDDVLRQLSAGGSFRTANSGGFVLGVAQCVGDLSSGDCGQCLSEAISQLRQGCGSALYGDVYLGKCYARYSSSGFYDHTTHDSNKDDEAGKTLAIIIGLFAGVALIIVFLSFLRKVCCGKGY